jgi:hypothetical protein
VTVDRPDGEELLDSPRPVLRRRARLAAIAALALAVAAGIAVAAWPDDHHSRPVAAPTSPSPAGSTPVRSSTVATTAPTSPYRLWPSAPAACGADQELALVAGAVPVTGHTGITVALAGTRLAYLDVDSGEITRPAGPVLAPDEYAGSLSGGRTEQLVTFNCRGTDFGPPRLIRLTNAGPVAVRLPPRIDVVLVDGAREWGLRWSAANYRPSTLIPIGTGAPVRLPRGFAPEAITDGVLVGHLARSSINTGVLVLVDAATGLVRRNLGAAQELAAADGIVVWTTGCEIDRAAPCTAHRQSVDGGAITNYRLPRPPGFAAAALSPDHRLLAFIMERAHQDPRFKYGHPFPPTDVAVLHLDTGVVETVPGIEIPGKSSPALGFTDDDWLVIGLGAGARTRVLAWRSGQPHPMESRPVPGLVGSPPAMLVLRRPGAITRHQADR